MNSSVSTVIHHLFIYFEFSHLMELHRMVVAIMRAIK